MSPLLFATEFTGFSPDDFAAFSEEKWASNVFTRARMRVTEKLEAIASDVGDLLQPDQHHLVAAVTDPRPSIFNGHQVRDAWLYLSRTEDAKKTLSTILDKQVGMAELLADPAHYKRHLVLAIRVTHQHVTTGLFLHRRAWVDAHNAAGRLDDDFDRNMFDELLEKLRLDFPELKLEGGSEPVALANVDGELVKRHLAELTADGARRSWLVFGETIPSSATSLADRGMAQRAAAKLTALRPIYSFLAWSPENDHLGLRIQMDRMKKEVEQEKGALGEGSEVMVTSGLFAGKRGVVTEHDHKGMLKVKIGGLVVQVKKEAVRLL